MADEKNGNGGAGDPVANAQPEPEGVTPAGTPGDPATSSPAGGKSDLQKALDALNSERDVTSRLRKELTKRDAEAKKQERAQLEKAGEYQKLYEEASAELELAKASQERVTKLEGAINASVQMRIERIPEGMRDLIPEDYTPEQKAAWLDRNEAKLTAPGAPNLNAGAGAGLPTMRNGTLTPEEIAAGQRYGVSAQDMLRTKQLMGGAQIQPGDYGGAAMPMPGYVQRPGVLGVQPIVGNQSQQPGALPQPGNPLAPQPPQPSPPNPEANG